MHLIYYSIIPLVLNSSKITLHILSTEGKKHHLVQHGVTDLQDMETAAGSQEVDEGQGGL